MKFLPLIWASLRRKRLRTLLTLLSIMMAFVLFGFLSAIRQALAGAISVAGADRLIVRHRVSIIQMLSETYEARMERIPGVAAAVHQTWFGGIYRDARNFFMQCPVVPDDFMAMFPELVLPPAQLKAWRETRTGAIVGRNTADRFGWKIGDKIPLRATIWRRGDGGANWEFDLVGIYDGREKSTDTTPFFFRYDYFDENRRTSFGQGLVGWYTVRVSDPAQAAAVARAIDAEFENSSAETKTEPEGAFVQAWVSQIGNITFIVAAILAAVFFTILLVAGNTMAQSVRERTGELGVLKAIGFTPARVLALVLAESSVLAIVGGATGIGLAAVMIARGDPTGGLLPMFHFPARDAFVGVVLSIVLGFVTGAIPARQAVRLQAAESLRRM